MARTTVAELEVRVNSIDEKLDKLIEVMSGKQAATKGHDEPKPKKERPWIDPCPDYATAAQRAEYDKLAERAKGQRKAMEQAMGTKSVRAFIPVSKRDQTRMPHSIQWTATYSK